MTAEELADVIAQLLGFDRDHPEIEEVNGGAWPASVEVIDADGNTFLVEVSAQP